ncbi:hypothetical protein IGI04_023558, partial [Brassica rapa subsp. trilocularis]
RFKTHPDATTCFLSVHFLRKFGEHDQGAGWYRYFCSMAYFVAPIGDRLTRQIINFSILLLLPSDSLYDLSGRGSSTCCSTPHLFGQVGPQQITSLRKKAGNKFEKAMEIWLGKAPQPDARLLIFLDKLVRNRFSSLRKKAGNKFEKAMEIWFGSR